ncbi:MAG: SDR family NAD(P)-dependent oxidoreductase [Methanobacteriota archaeon]
MRVLVTGGTGFIGSHLAEALAARGDDVLVVDTYETSRRDTLSPPPKRVEVLELDISDRDSLAKVFERFGPDRVIHAAASYKAPDAWERDIVVNALGTANVVQECQKRRVARLVYFQTALCYGNRPLAQPIPLDHPLNPESSYAISKTAGEQYIALSGLSFVSFRLANVYGPRNLSGPIPTFFKRLSENAACFAVDTRRDFIFVPDMVPLVLRGLDGEGSGMYHISSGADFSIEEVYHAVASALGRDGPVEKKPRAPDDAPTILLDPSRTTREFGWRARTPLRDGIAKTVEWYKKHGVEQTFTHLREPGPSEPARAPGGKR